MRNRKGFTLIELMVVILIVSILAAVAIPIMRGRIDAAKWSEGRAMAGTLATAVRAYAAEKGDEGTYGGKTALTLTMLGFETSDFDGTYFDSTNYDWDVDYDSSAATPLTFSITVTAPADITTPSEVELDQDGEWTVTE